LQCLHKQRSDQKPKWPKHESTGALTESASVSILLHTQAAQPNSSTCIYPRAPAKDLHSRLSAVQLWAAQLRDLGLLRT